MCVYMIGTCAAEGCIAQTAVMGHRRIRECQTLVNMYQYFIPVTVYTCTARAGHRSTPRREAVTCGRHVSRDLHKQPDMRASVNIKRRKEGILRANH